MDTGATVLLCRVANACIIIVLITVSRHIKTTVLMFLDRKTFCKVFIKVKSERKVTPWTYESHRKVTPFKSCTKNTQWKGKTRGLPGSICQAGHRAISTVRSADTSLSGKRKIVSEPRVILFFFLNVAALGKLPVLVFWKVKMSFLVQGERAESKSSDCTRGDFLYGFFIDSYFKKNWEYEIQALP